MMHGLGLSMEAVLIGVDKCRGWNAGGRPGQSGATLECRLSSAWILLCSMMQLSFIRGQVQRAKHSRGSIFSYSSILTPPSRRAHEPQTFSSRHSCGRVSNDMSCRHRGRSHYARMPLIITLCSDGLCLFRTLCVCHCSNTLPGTLFATGYHRDCRHGNKRSGAGHRCSYPASPSPQ